MRTQFLAYAQAQCAERTARSWYSNACARVAQHLSASAHCYVRPASYGVGAIVVFGHAPVGDGPWLAGCALRGGYTEARAYSEILRALEHAS